MLIRLLFFGQDQIEAFSLINLITMGLFEETIFPIFVDFFLVMI